MDERLNTLRRWVAGILGVPVVLTPASADASFRRYFRVSGRDNDTYVVMDAPPEHESVATFARVAARFAALGLNVPVVHALDRTQGFALLSDLGTHTYLSVLDDDNAGRLYQDALAALHRLQAASRERAGGFPEYDAVQLKREMELFREWFVPCRSGRRLDRGDHATIDATFELLTVSALEQPRVWVHRDFHSRNLMVVDAGNPGVLDFQDALLGPVTYDLVSLLRDCYIVWPEERIAQWLDDYYHAIRPVLGAADPGPQRFTRWFDWMGVQRHIKVLGIFTRLFHRDGKANYLDDLPTVHAYVCEVCGRYPELQPFGHLLARMETAWTH